VHFISDHFFSVMVVLLCDCVVYEIYNYLLFFCYSIKGSKIVGRNTRRN